MAVLERFVVVLHVYSESCQQLAALRLVKTRSEKEQDR